MIHKCACQQCLEASVRNLDALTVFVHRLSVAAAHARRLLDEGDAAKARDLIDAAAIRAADLAQDMIAYGHLLDQHQPEAEAAARPTGRLH